MINSFEGLTGDSLELWFKELFSNHLKFEYYSSSGQIDLSLLDPSQQKGHHLEIDGIMLINKTCVFLEYTDQAKEPREKIKKFTRNCHLFVSSTALQLKEKFKLFGIPSKRLKDFEEVQTFKYAYFGTHNSFESSSLDRKDFPDYQDIQRNLFIFKPTDVEYLRQLTSLINYYARYEFLSALNFTPLELGDLQVSLHLDFIKITGKYVTADDKIKADVYLLKFKVKELIEIARVSRYEGIPFILDENIKAGYQRFLIEQKLKNISNSFIINNSNKSFPNTITLVLPSNCKEEDIEGNQKLTIPKRYGSVDIIDGQHRLFAYTDLKIKDSIRNNSEILASAIKFRNNDIPTITKNSAKVFCEINSNQAKVKTNLLYLIKYDVLGDTDEIALAGKIILECNRGNSGSALTDLFFTNSLRRKNKLNLPSIPVPTIIDNDLVPFIKGLMPDGNLISDTQYRSVFGHDRKYFKRNPDKIVSAAKVILERYFNYFRKIFNQDWKIDASTHLISAKYISAFIRLLRKGLFVDSLNITDMEDVLKNLKVDVDAITHPKNSPSFPKDNDLIPSTKFGINRIYEFLNDTSTYPSSD